MAIPELSLKRSYYLANERYAELGVDVEARLAAPTISVSLHCWQGDDVGGFENAGAAIGGGGMAVTGNYPGQGPDAGRAAADLDKRCSLIPGKHRLNLHASYAETGGQAVERDELSPSISRAGSTGPGRKRLGLDFNPTFFAHPLAADGFTLAHPDAGIRRFWIDHGIACRRIGAAMGRRWVAMHHERLDPRRLEGHRRSTAKGPASASPSRSTPSSPSRSTRSFNRDAVECKLFGIGSESYVVGSHEFYLGYADHPRKAPLPRRRPLPPD